MLGSGLCVVESGFKNNSHCFYVLESGLQMLDSGFRLLGAADSGCPVLVFRCFCLGSVCPVLNSED